MKCLDGLMYLVLGIAMVAGIVYGTRPARAEHDPALWRGCVRHLTLCAKCREAGLTPARMVELDTPTRCYSFGPIADANAPAYQLMPANSGQ
jgi:hypothetical protein